ncbi:MAG: HAD family hydrolase [Micrococcales bacterium]
MDELLEEILPQPQAGVLRTRGRWFEFLASLIFAFPAFYFSTSWQDLLQYRAVSFPLAAFAPAAGGTLAAAVAIFVFARQAISKLRRAQIGQPALALLALLLGLTHSYLIFVSHPAASQSQGDFFWQVAGAAVFLITGEWFVARRSAELQLEPVTAAPVGSRSGVFSLMAIGVALAMTAAGSWSASVSLLAGVSVAAALVNAPWTRATAIDAAEAIGVFVLKREAFNSLRRAKLVLIELTGIITSGERRFAEVFLTRRGGMESEDELLSVLAGLEAGGGDPIARAVIEEAQRRGVLPTEVKDLMKVPGIGISGRLAEYRVSAGGPALLTRQKIEIDPLELMAADAMNSDGKTVVYVIRDSVLLGFVSLTEHLRPSAVAAVQALHQLNRSVGFITSEAHGVARALADRMDVEEVFAEVLPHDKAKVVEQVQAKYGPVALAAFPEFDSTALSAAAIGIAMVDEANEEQVDAENTAMVLDSTDPADVASVVRLDAIAQRRERMAAVAVWGYNTVGVTLLAIAGNAVAASAVALVVLLLTAFNAWMVNRSIR